eukprot:SAG22_NODE_2734_length_2267_cov_2.444188_1_plen_233_part_10
MLACAAVQLATEITSSIWSFENIEADGGAAGVAAAAGGPTPAPLLLPLLLPPLSAALPLPVPPPPSPLSGELLPPLAPKLAMSSISDAQPLQSELPGNRILRSPSPMMLVTVPIELWSTPPHPCRGVDTDRLTRTLLPTEMEDDGGTGKAKEPPNAPPPVVLPPNAGLDMPMPKEPVTGGGGPLKNENADPDGPDPLCDRPERGGVANLCLVAEPPAVLPAAAGVAVPAAAGG